MNKIAAAKEFVVRNKKTIIVGAVAIAAVSIMKVGLNQHDEFLREHDLYEAFYHSED